LEIAPYPEITAKRGVYEVGRALRARRSKRDRSCCELLNRKEEIGQSPGVWRLEPRWEGDTVSVACPIESLVVSG